MSWSHKYIQKYENISESDFNLTKKSRKTNHQKDMVLIQYTITKDFSVEEHFHDWLEMTYVVEGEQIIKIDDKEYLLSTGDFLLINYNLLHSSTTLKECKKITFQIKRSYLQHHMPQFNPDYIHCNSTEISTVEEYNQYKDIIDIYLEMVDYFKEEDEISELGFAGSLFHLIYYLSKNFSQKDGQANHTGTKYNEVLKQMMSYIYKNYEMGITLKEVSDIFHLSPQYISKIFKEGKNMTFMEALNEVRVNHAVYEIVNSHKKLVEICYECGFSNNKSFINIFKRKYGMTPSQYRMKNQKRV